MISTRLRWPHLEAIILALSLQMAVPLGVVGIDTKVAASHLVLPYFMAAATVAFCAGRRFQLVIGWWWVAGFFALAFLLMLHGLYVGAQHTGQPSGLGVRRVVSTVLMFGYFLSGVYLASHGSRIRDGFALSFVAAAAGIALVSYIAHFATHIGIGLENRIFLADGNYRLQGLMDGPVLFSWLLLSAFVFHLAFQERLQAQYPRLNIAGFSILFTALVVVGAKAAWVGAAVAAGILYATLRPRPAFGPLAVGLLIALVLIVPAVLIPAKGTGTSFLSQIANEEMHVPNSVVVREGQFALAVDLIREHPVWGVGLGGYTWEEARRGLVVQHYLHNSLLWLWTELGPFAVVLFLAFFFRVARALWPTRAENRDEPFDLAVFALIWSFAAISTVDNVLYQRYLWVFVGAALSIPSRKHNAAREPDGR